MALTTYMRSWQDFEYVTLATLPLFLFSATFFPLSAFPTWLQWVVEVTPLYRGVVLVRELTTGVVTWDSAVSVVYLAAMGVGRRCDRRASPRQAAAELRSPGRCETAAMASTDDRVPTVAVIGGSGFYEFLDDPSEVDVETPYGDPAAPIAVGDVGGRSVAFLPRHGKGHEFPPHRINYRANIWALKSLGVERILAPCAVGGLQPETQPATLVVPDQLVDRTTGRVQTYVDRGAAHAPFADPYCPDLRAALVSAAGEGVHRRRDDGGHRGAALLHPRGVAELCEGRLDGREHDRPPRGRARPRAGRLLRHDRPGHRPRRRRQPRGVGRPGAGVRALRAAHRPAQGDARPRSSPGCPSPSATAAAPTGWPT